MKQSFCMNCGKNLSDLGSSSFCPNCGARILQEQPAANVPEPSSPAYQPVQPYVAQPSYCSQVYAMAGQGTVRKKLSVGAIVGIVAGAIVLIAMLAFVLLRPGLFGGSFSSNPTSVGGNWDAVLRVKRVQGDKNAVRNLNSLTGKDFHYILALQLSEEGSGAAEIVPSQEGMEKLTGLKASLANGALTLTGTDSLSFSFMSISLPVK